MAERFGHALHPGLHTQSPDAPPIVDDQPADDELGVRPHIVVDLHQQSVGINFLSADRSREAPANSGHQNQSIKL